MGFKRNHYTLQRIDVELESLIKEFADDPGKSFREASKKFAEFHKKLKWESEVKKRMFQFFTPAVAAWALGYLMIISSLRVII